jgi:hypothetical protein
LSGTFANLDSGGRVYVQGGTGSFQVTITPTQVVLSDFHIIPEPRSSLLTVMVLFCLGILALPRFNGPSCHGARLHGLISASEVASGEF